MPEPNKENFINCPVCNGLGVKKTGFNCPECKDDKIKLVDKFLKKVENRVEPTITTIKPLDIANKKGKKYLIFKNGDAEITKKK